MGLYSMSVNVVDVFENLGDLDSPLVVPVDLLHLLPQRHDLPGQPLLLTTPLVGHFPKTRMKVVGLLGQSSKLLITWPPPAPCSWP